MFAEVRTYRAFYSRAQILNEDRFGYMLLYMATVFKGKFPSLKPKTDYVNKKDIIKMRMYKD